MTIFRLTRSFFSRILHVFNHEPASGNEPACGHSKPTGPEDIAGGQAVIEGVMMRHGNRIAVAVRTPAKDIVIKEQDYIPFTKRYPVLGHPRHPRRRDASGDDGPRHQDTPVLRRDRHAGGREETAGLGDRAFALPEFRHGADPLRPDPRLLLRIRSGTSSRARSCSISSKGIIRLGIFLTFLATTLFMEDMRRVFMYHGAEHKTVFAWEHGQELTIENIKHFSTRHPRCGTSFILVVFVTRSSSSRCWDGRIS